MEFILPDDFKYDYFLKNRYLMPKYSPIKNGIEYEGMCNNGYIKLYTIPGKIYWLLQNELCHSTPDWKFHVSVKDCDIQHAWNLIAKIFIEKQCKSSMKVKYTKENKLTVRGREITIYISIYDPIYDKSDIGKDFHFNKEIEQDEDFWYDLFDKVETSLKENKIKSNGSAKGDLPLGNYVSFRNEAFIICNNENIEIYPPDKDGWNAKKHDLPFNIIRFQRVKEINSSPYFMFLVVGTLIIFALAFILRN